MEILDTISADQIEENDLILIDGEEVEVRSIVECDDIDGVSFHGYSRSTGDTEVYELPFDYPVHILGV